MYLSTFLKNEYLTSTHYIFRVLGVLEYWSTVLDPNPGIYFGYLVYLSTWSTVLDPNPAVYEYKCIGLADLNQAV